MVYFWHYLLPPANEVCEDNVFIGVCLSIGGLCPGGSLSRGVCVRETHLYGKEQAVCILLECIFVLKQFLPVTTCGQGNIFTSVCHSFCSQGDVCLSACWDSTPPPEQKPPLGADTSPGSRPPQSRPLLPPGADTPPGSRSPREQTPPQSRHPPWSRHPPPPGSKLRHMVNERPVRILLECILVAWKSLNWNVCK